jgi:ketosteroid isomerase-like protein
MRNTNKTILFVALAMISDLSLFAQSIKDDKMIDGIYTTFREMYQKIDIDRFQELYTADSRFMAFDGKISKDKKEWLPGMASFFEEVKKAGDSMDILFQIESREISGDLAYDAGYFLFMRNGSKTEKTCGKMVNVFRKIKNEDGSIVWKFAVDMSSDAPIGEFVGKETITKNFKPFK